MNGTRIADMDQAAVIQALQSPRLALDVVRAEEELEFQLTLE